VLMGMYCVGRDLVEVIEVVTSPLGQKLLHRRPATLASKIYFLIKAVITKLGLAPGVTPKTSNTSSSTSLRWLEDVVRQLSTPLSLLTRLQLIQVRRCSACASA
jgi:hypothetical protein